MNYKQSDNINDVIVHSVFYSCEGWHIVTPINCGYNDKYIRKCCKAYTLFSITCLKSFQTCCTFVSQFYTTRPKLSWHQIYLALIWTHSSISFVCTIPASHAIYQLPLLPNHHIATLANVFSYFVFFLSINWQIIQMNLYISLLDQVSRGKQATCNRIVVFCTPLMKPLSINKRRLITCVPGIACWLKKPSWAYAICIIIICIFSKIFGERSVVALVIPLVWVPLSQDTTQGWEIGNKNIHYSSMLK